jgi:hypothetical protein
MRADLKLNLPSPVRVGVLHPEFERAEFRDGGFDPHGDDLPCRNIGQSRKLDFQQAGFFQLAFGVGLILGHPSMNERPGAAPPLGGALLASSCFFIEPGARIF